MSNTTTTPPKTHKAAVIHKKVLFASYGIFAEHGGASLSWRNGHLPEWKFVGAMLIKGAAIYGNGLRYLYDSAENDGAMVMVYRIDERYLPILDEVEGVANGHYERLGFKSEKLGMTIHVYVGTEATMEFPGPTNSLLRTGMRNEEQEFIRILQFAETRKKGKEGRLVTRDNMAESFSEMCTFSLDLAQFEIEKSQQDYGMFYDDRVKYDDWWDNYPNGQTKKPHDFGFHPWEKKKDPRDEEVINYFAFGSNLSTERMLKRCPSAKPIAVAQLKGYELVIDSYADVRPAKGKAVHGVIYSITRADSRELDRYEASYDRIRIQEDEMCVNRFIAEETSQLFVELHTYVKSLWSRISKPATAHYISICRRGFQEHELDENLLLAASRLNKLPAAALDGSIGSNNSFPVAPYYKGKSFPVAPYKGKPGYASTKGASK